MTAAKVRDPGNTLRTLTALKVRDAANILRTLASAKVRDAGNVLRTVYAAGGGGGSASVWIDPAETDTASRVSSAHSSGFTAMYGGGVAPTAYAWSLVSVSDGTASIVGATNAAAATLRVVADGVGSQVVAQFQCDVTIGGVVYTAYCTKTHSYLGSGGQLP